MISRLNLYDSNRNRFNLEEIGLYGSKLTIPSPSYSVQTVEIDNGQTIVTDKRINPRELKAEFLTKALDYKDVLEQKSLLFGLLGNGEKFYIEQTHRSNILWKVHLGNWTPEHVGTKSTSISIPLTCYSGMSETINFVRKTFNEPNFYFNNEGSVLIDPRYHELEITIKGDFPNGLTLRNETTGDIYEFRGALSPTDELKLVGVRSLLNEKSVLGQTNLKLITFSPGRNNIVVSSSEEPFEITIKTRVYLL